MIVQSEASIKESRLINNIHLKKIMLKFTLINECKLI